MVAKGNKDNDMSNADDDVKPLANNVNNGYTEGDDNEEYATGDDNNEYTKGSYNDESTDNRQQWWQQVCQGGHHAEDNIIDKPLTRGKDKGEYAKGNNNNNEVYTTPLFAHVNVVMANIQAMDGGLGYWSVFDEEPLAKEGNGYQVGRG